MLEKLEVTDFIKHLNTTFQFSSNTGEQVEVRLVEVTEIGSSNAPTDDIKRRKSFSIVFAGPPQPILPQGIHTLHHSEMKTVKLFIVPIGQDNEGIRYEAVFN